LSCSFLLLSSTKLFPAIVPFAYFSHSPTESFKGGTFASLMQAIEDLYLHEQITQRVYVKAKLLLWTNVPPQQERQVS